MNLFYFFQRCLLNSDEHTRLGALQYVCVRPNAVEAITRHERDLILAGLPFVCKEQRPGFWTTYVTRTDFTSILPDVRASISDVMAKLVQRIRASAQVMSKSNAKYFQRDAALAADELSAFFALLWKHGFVELTMVCNQSFSDRPNSRECITV